MTRERYGAIAMRQATVDGAGWRHAPLSHIILTERRFSWMMHELAWPVRATVFLGRANFRRCR